MAISLFLVECAESDVSHLLKAWKSVTRRGGSTSGSLYSQNVLSSERNRVSHPLVVRSAAEVDFSNIEIWGVNSLVKFGCVWG